MDKKVVFLNELKQEQMSFILGLPLIDSGKNRIFVLD